MMLWRHPCSHRVRGNRHGYLRLRAGNGDDFVHDFRQSDHDRIDVSAYGFQSLADMTIIDTGADTRIEFDATNSVTLVGFADPGLLQASDFIFA